jgi:nickel-dependent lactate racemase
MPTVECQLEYGASGRFSCELDSERLIAVHASPEPLADVRGSVSRALQEPCEFPAFERSVFPDDRLALVLDRYTPCAADVIAEVWSVLARRGVNPTDVTIVQPADFKGQPLADPRAKLPTAARHAVAWHVHDPTQHGGCAYLASTTSGERVYLSRQVVEADVVVSIGSLEYDSLLGYRGTNSALYPGLSNADAIRKAHGQGHDELTPDDPRPLRQLVDEIAWLLGTQFSIQVVPGAGHGIAAVIAGLAEPVLDRGKELLARSWRLDVGRRPELVIAAVDSDAAGHSWPQLAAALDLARQVVARDGRVVVLTELEEEPTDGIRLIKESRAPRDALQPIRAAAPPDLIAATQIAKALDWMNVYLVSRLDPQLVEDLFMIPLSGPDEVSRLIVGNESCAVIGGAQHAAVRHVVEPGARAS